MKKLLEKEKSGATAYLAANSAVSVVNKKFNKGINNATSHNK